VSPFTFVDVPVAEMVFTLASFFSPPSASRTIASTLFASAP
jgi:hypothetical protein